MTAKPLAEPVFTVPAADVVGDAALKATAVVVAVYAVVAWKKVPFDTDPWLAVGPAV